MSFQNYDDYMRNTLGYPNMSCPCMYPNIPMSYPNMYESTDCLEKMYPDTYRIIYPMVVSACDMVTMPITEEMLNQMTDDIYDRAITDDRISIDINIEVETREGNSNSQISNEVRQRRPRRRNRFFRDLIRILLLRELLGRHPRFPRSF